MVLPINGYYRDRHIEERDTLASRKTRNRNDSHIAQTGIFFIIKVVTLGFTNLTYQIGAEMGCSIFTQEKIQMQDITE